MTISVKIEDDEDLGRGIFSSHQRKLSQRNQIPAQVFCDDNSPACISVDRFRYASEEKLAELGDANARKREPIGKRKFYGWAVISAVDAAKSGRKVESSPNNENPHHADIYLPDDAKEDEEIREWHAGQLASEATWRERPMP